MMAATLPSPHRDPLFDSWEACSLSWIDCAIGTGHPKVIWEKRVTVCRLNGRKPRESPENNNLPSWSRLPWLCGPPHPCFLKDTGFTPAKASVYRTTKIQRQGAAGRRPSPLPHHPEMFWRLKGWNISEGWLPAKDPAAGTLCIK